MYKSDKYQIGKYEVLKIGRDEGPAIEVIPSRGGVLQQIFLGQTATPILSSFEDETDIRSNEKYKQTVLFPFPNRLKDGRFLYENTGYAFPINEPDRNNALHGMVYNQEFTVTELDLTNEYGKLELAFLYHGQNEAYPFPFTLRTIYEIGEASFIMHTRVENTGYGDLPYGFGWHPYFKTDSIAEFRGQEAQFQEVNERMLPTGDQKAYDFGQNKRVLQEQLDNAFRIAENESINLDLGLFEGKMINIQADDSFRFFQIYNPASDTIAVEPVTCNVNALNTGDELIHLSKGESKEHRIEISFL